MSLTDPGIARDRIERFVARFGEPYRQLAWYAALPLILTPELLGYLRTAFLRGRDGVDWIAEADLLLSDLCRPVGDEQYALDQALRACLLDEMRKRLGEVPMREAAQLLLCYVRHLAPSEAGLRAEELEAEQWSAMAYLDKHRGEAARQITAALGAGLMPPAPGAAAVGISAAELARLVALTDELAPNLAAHPQLLEYARVVAEILSAPERLRDLDERLVAGEALPTRWVEGVQVPDPSERARPADRPAGPGEDGPLDSPIHFRDPFLDGSGDGPEMVWLPGGTFRMGSPPGVGYDSDSERPDHRVQLGHYAVGKYPVTVGEFRCFVDATGYRTEAEVGGGACVFDRDRDQWDAKSDANWRKPYMVQDDRHPVVCVSWNDARAYCDWLGKETGQTYGLLTEAQWEHACRAGRQSRWCFNENDGRLYEYAWYRDNAGEATHPVGQKLANAWDLCDLHGNVYEWCQDWWADSYAREIGSGPRSDGEPARARATGGRAAVSSGEQPLQDPVGPNSGSYRVVRGGAWSSSDGRCRSAFRNCWQPSYRLNLLGFRLSRTGLWHSSPITLGAAEPPPVRNTTVASHVARHPDPSGYRSGAMEATMTTHAFGGPWTEKKLRILVNYLKFYTTALHRYFRTVYIDAFAGNGYCVIQSDGEPREIPGSATIALETSPPFDEYHLLEARPDFAAQLLEISAAHPDKHIRVYTGDVNRQLPPLIDGDWSGRRGVLFLDPYGLDLDWALVRRIAATKALDVWFLVSLSGIYRQTAHEYADMDDVKKTALDRFLGTQEWRTAFYRQGDLLSPLHAGRTASWEDIAKYVKTRLESEFAGGVTDPIVLRMDKTPLYCLYFALANPDPKAMRLALRVAADIMR